MSKKLSAPIDFYFWAGAINFGMLAMVITPNFGSWVLAQGTKPQVSETKPVSDKLTRFLDVIAHAEGTNENYDILMGGDRFTDFSKHPDQCKPFFNPATQQQDCSTGAGRYQFITTTWAEIKRRENLPDFSPTSQDKAALARLKDLGVDKLLEQGKFEEALKASANTWVSLAPNASKQRVAPLEELRKVYQGQKP